MSIRYNHACDIAFSLVSDHPRGEDITGPQLRSAIQLRLNSLSDEELIEAVGLPFDTYEELDAPSS